MKTSHKGIDLIFKYEVGGNLKKYLTAYWDATGKVWTIGIGSTYYEDGSPVKKGDVITEQRARNLFANILPRYEQDVLRLVKKPINQNQFDALVSLVYNIGASNFAKSTMLKKININPDDLTIKAEFPKYKYSGGVILNGLIRRRNEEAELYFTPAPNKGGVITKRTTSDLHLRTGSGTKHASITVLPMGTEVNILREENGWSEVFVCSTKQKGWVSNKYIQ